MADDPPRRIGVHYTPEVWASQSAYYPTSSYGFGLRFQPAIRATANDANLIGTSVESIFGSEGFTGNSAFSLFVDWTLIAPSNGYETTYTIENAWGIFVDMSNRPPYALVNHAIGLEIVDQTGGALSNWAIKTGLGKVRFGDNVSVGGDGIVSEWGGANYTQLQVNAATFGGYPIYSLSSNRTDANNNRVGALTWDVQPNTSGYRNIALIEAWTNGITANKRGGALHFRVAADNMAGTADVLTVSSGSSGVRFNQYGTGTLTTDANGNISASGALEARIAAIEARLAAAGIP